MDTSFNKANSDNPTIKNEVNNQISVGYTERARSATNKLCCYNNRLYKSNRKHTRYTHER